MPYEVAMEQIVEASDAMVELLTQLLQVHSPYPRCRVLEASLFTAETGHLRASTVALRSCFKIIKLDFSVGYVFYKVPID